jgi:hypothetical protein
MNHSIDGIIYCATPWGYIRMREDIIRQRDLPDPLPQYRATRLLATRSDYEQVAWKHDELA